MATTVYTTEDIILQDGSELTLKRINIKLQREFMRMFETMEQPESNDEATDQMLDLVEICLRGIDKELAADRDKMEEQLDEPTVFKIIEVCAGVKLNDPNLLAAAAMAMQNQATAGQT